MQPAPPASELHTPSRTSILLAAAVPNGYVLSSAIAKIAKKIYSKKGKKEIVWWLAA